MFLISERLEDFIVRRGCAIPHTPTADAPSSWPELQAWSNANHWGNPGRWSPPLPVYSGGNDGPLPVRHATTQYAFRAWHDSIHLLNGLDFSLEDELAVAAIHVQATRHYPHLDAFDRECLWALVAGQRWYAEVHPEDEFVYDQAAFTASCLEHGIQETIEIDWSR